MDTIETLVNSLEHYLEAKREHDEARQKYGDNGGYSWEWYGRAWIEQCNKAKAEFGKELADFIDARLARAAR